MDTSIAAIIPTYNRGHCLPRAIDSVLNQSLPPTEVCVVDDGSTDDTGALLARDYPQVKYCRQPRAGVSAARNAGVRATASRWLAFLDSDDQWLPDKLARQMHAWRQQPHYRVIHGDEIWIRKGVRVNPMDKHAKAGGHIFEHCLLLCAISPSAVMLERSLFNGMGGFDESLPACEDYDLWLRVCSRYPVLYVDQPVLKKYGGHADQLSRQHWGMDRFRVRALDKLLTSTRLSVSQRSASRRILQEKCRILLQGAGKRGNTKLVAQIESLQAKHDLVPAS